jgi:hypothetical protein
MENDKAPEKGGNIEVGDDDTLFSLVTRPTEALSILSSAFRSPTAFFKAFSPVIIIDTNKTITLNKAEKKK